MVHARVLRAGIPHAIIEEINTTEAERMPGVVCVLTEKDIPGVNRDGIAFQDQYALAEDRVRYVGDPEEELVRAIPNNYHTVLETRELA